MLLLGLCTLYINLAACMNVIHICNFSAIFFFDYIEEFIMFVQPFSIFIFYLFFFSVRVCTHVCVCAFMCMGVSTMILLLCFL